MKATLQTFGMASAPAAALALVLTACGGGGGGYNSPPTSPSPPSGNTATVTIRAGGTVDPKEIRIDVGQQVRFVNEDGQAHQPTSNPHPAHTDCPEIRLSPVSPGQSATTGAFNTAKSCGYHDHMDADRTQMHGVIRVGGDNAPTGPVYLGNR